MGETLLQTTVVGSYPQPNWLVDRQLLSKGVPRTRVKDMWRVSEPWLEQAQDEAACRSWAQQQTGMYPGQSVPEYYGNPYANEGAPVLRGAARGAALGAVGGAIAGDAGKGAAIGAGVGGTAGLLRRNRERRAEANYNQQAQVEYQQDMSRYNQAFAACMQGRNYTVR